MQKLRIIVFRVTRRRVDACRRFEKCLPTFRRNAYRRFGKILTDVSEKCIPIFRKHACRCFGENAFRRFGKTLTDISNKRVPTFRKMLTDVSEKRIPTFRGNACRRFGNKSFVPRHHSKWINDASDWCTVTSRRIATFLTSTEVATKLSVRKFQFKLL